MRGRVASAALPALVVFVLVAVVAIAATGSTPGGSSETRRPSETLYDVIFTIGLVGVGLGSLLLVYGLTQRKAIAQQVATGKYPRTTLVVYLIGMTAFAAMFYAGLIRWDPSSQTSAEDSQGAFRGEASLPTLPDEAETSYMPTVSWIPIAVVFALLAAAVAAYVVAERRADRARGTVRERLAEEIAVVLEETVDDLRAEDDPRRAIIAAYARLERVLAANGVPRRPAETTTEYVERVLDELELHSPSVRTLTNLFVQAKFSDHALDAAMKTEAIDAFERIRDELRSGEASAPKELRGATA